MPCRTMVDRRSVRMAQETEEKKSMYFFIRATDIDSCQAKISEMGQLAVEMERILNEKKLQLKRRGMEMQINTVMTSIKEDLKDELWRMCQIREEIKGQLCLPEEVEDRELVVAVDMSEIADEYTNLEDMRSKLGVEATVHALENGMQQMSEQPKRSKVITAGAYRVLRECTFSTLEEGAMVTENENSMWVMTSDEKKPRKRLLMDDDSWS